MFFNANNALQDILASDFMAISPDEKDCEIDFNWDDCRIFMKDQIQSLAEQRYFSMLKECGKIGDGGDPDYMPCFPPPPKKTFGPNPRTGV